MQPERWQRVEEIFHEVAELPLEQRQARLEALCGSDAELRADVESLLAHEGAELGGIRHAALAVGADLAAESAQARSDQWTGQRLGAYRILAPLGEGGMGMVFTAVRDDAEFEKTVAVKVIKDSGGLTAAREEKFLEERQILARLEHPYITRLLDGGRTAEGAPFIVMELVDGAPITKWCDDRKLGIPERLRLFLRVCDAVQYAHQQLVIHRDLKPTNILVTQAGEPKLLDFGIAKLIDPAANSEWTATPALLTPDYASPEQVRGEPVSTATDIYALGAILHQLLTGHKPHELSTYGPAEIAEAVCGRDPQLMSAVAPEGLRRKLKGDLDAIVSKAMRKVPVDRYGSVEQLAADIKRHLDGLPVEARKGSARYRVVKFVRRRALALAAAAAVLITLGGGIISTRIQAKRAEARFQQVREIANGLLFETYDKLQQVQGATAVRADLADAGQRYLESLYAEAGDDPVLLHELVLSFRRMALVQGGNPVSTHVAGQATKAEANFKRASELGDRLLRIDPTRKDALRDVTMVNVEFAQFAVNNSSRDAALAQLARSRDLLSRAAAVDPGDDMPKRMLVGLWGLTGDLTKLQDLKAGTEAYRKSLEVAGTIKGPIGQHNAAIAGDRLAGALIESGEQEEAIAVNQRSCKAYDELERAEPANLRRKREHALSCGQLAEMLGMDDMTPSRRSEAIPLAERSLSSLEELAADKDDARAQSDLAIALARLAGILSVPDPARSLRASQRAAEIFERFHAASPTNTFVHEGLGTTLALEGELLARSGQTVAGVAICRRGVSMLDELGKTLGIQFDRAQALARLHLARALAVQGLTEQAEAVRKEAEAIAREKNEREKTRGSEFLLKECLKPLAATRFDGKDK